MENKNCYTKLTLEIQYPDNPSPTKVELTEPHWDLEGAKVIKMLHRVMNGHGWYEKGFQTAMENYMEELQNE